jgi:hypothetical protein
MYIKDMVSLFGVPDVYSVYYLLTYLLYGAELQSYKIIKADMFVWDETENSPLFANCC